MSLDKLVVLTPPIYMYDIEKPTNQRWVYRVAAAKQTSGKSQGLLSFVLNVDNIYACIGE